MELDLLIALRPALAATIGFSAAETCEVLCRAQELAEQLDRPEHLVPLLWGHWGFRCTRAEHKLALVQAEKLEEFGAARDNVTLQLVGQLLHGVSCLHLGEFVAARILLERSLALADPAHRHSGQLPTEPYATALTNLAMVLAHLGFIDQARLRMAEALSEARRVGYVPALVNVLGSAMSFQWSIRLPSMHMKEFLSLTAEHDLRYYSVWGLVHQGRCLVATGRAKEALALLNQALAELRPSGALIGMPLLFTLLSRAHVMLGNPAEARRCLDEASRIVEITDERAAEAEVLHRVPGDLLNTIGDQAGAEQHYRQAIAVAERQSAKLFQLRASTRLARLWRDQGKPAEARNLLEPIYNWFTEGIDIPDLKDGKTLLDELARQCDGRRSSFQLPAISP